MKLARATGALMILALLQFDLTAISTHDHELELTEGPLVELAMAKQGRLLHPIGRNSKTSDEEQVTRGRKRSRLHPQLRAVIKTLNQMEPLRSLNKLGSLVRGQGGPQRRIFLPLRLLAALLRILLLPLRILLAPVIVLLRALRFLLRFLNPLYLLVLFFQGFNLVFQGLRIIAMIIARILMRIFRRRHRKREEEERTVITVVHRGLLDHHIQRRNEAAQLKSEAHQTDDSGRPPGAWRGDASFCDDIINLHSFELGGQQLIKCLELGRAKLRELDRLKTFTQGRLCAESKLARNQRWLASSWLLRQNVHLICSRA